VGREVKTMTDIRKIVELHELCDSKRQVARETGASRNTVKKYLELVKSVRAGKVSEILPKNREVHQPPRVVTPEVVEKIHQYLETNQTRPKKQRLTGKRIHELLRKDGHKLSYSSVKQQVADWKKEHGPREVYILQEPKQGERAEFDWGQVDLCIGGEWLKYHSAGMVLNHSLYRVSRLYSRETLLEVIQAHLEFFNEIKAVPPKMVYDQMSTVYNSKTKQINERFLEFATHYGFTPVICNPGSPQEKGTDEQSIGYVRRMAFAERTSFETLEEANAWLKERLLEINGGPVHRRCLTPIEGLELERPTMHPLPVLEFSNYILLRASISKYSFVSCDTNYYSVPDTYRPRHITLRLYENTIELLDGDAIIATHQRRRGKKEYCLDIAHFVKTFHRKPGAIRNAKVVANLDVKIRELFNRYYQNEPKEFLPVLDLIKNTSERALSYAIDSLAEQGIFPTCDTLKFVIREQDQMLQPFSITDSFCVDEPQLSVFDQLIGG
jgi:transposase